MKNIVIGLIVGLLLNGLIVFAKENIIINPETHVGNIGYGYVDTTKVTTSEGTYRLFVYSTRGSGGGITAVKIK